MSLQYDPNGNIYHLNRNEVTTGHQMDKLHYQYTTDHPNRLNFVKDDVDTNEFTTDIDNQNQDNYRYDAIGNLIADDAEGIKEIKWNVYGKITSIYNSRRGTTETFSYDAGGHRVKKDLDGDRTFYIRDAQGNVIGIACESAKCRA